MTPGTERQITDTINSQSSDLLALQAAIIGLASVLRETGDESSLEKARARAIDIADKSSSALGRIRPNRELIKDIFAKAGQI